MALAVAIPVAIACGPDFPFQLLDNRADTLTVLPDTSFAFEAAHLVPVPPDAPRPSNWHLDDGQDQAEYEAEQKGQSADAFERAAVEKQVLSPDQLAAVVAMRAAPTNEEALAAGKDLPRVVLFYTLGAFDFSRKNFGDAAKEFAQAIDAAADHPTLHSVWAAYMLGRSLAMQGDYEGAAKAFAKTRRMVIAGAPDPLDVGIATYGEEARLSIQDADKAKLSQTPGWQATRAHALENAVRLYAIQDAIDPNAGMASLMVMADEILSDNDDLPATFDDDLTRSLVIDYALSAPADDSNGALSFDVGHRTLGAFDKAALAVLPLGFDPMKNLRAIMEQRKSETIAGADGLAALAYRAGRYDLAGGFVAHSDTPLSLWVQAKLAVRAGNTSEATRLYALGVTALAKSATPPIDPDIAARVKGEQAVFALSRQDYVGAMQQLYPEAKTYWGDVAYLGERILTLDELKAFVDANVPADPSKKSDPSWPEPDLRELLARRLVREGHAEEAVGYFSEDNENLARNYATEVKSVETAVASVDRAMALYQMAESERRDGMELMGYETSPDYRNIGGQLDWGPGQTSVYGQQQPGVTPPSFEQAYTSVDEAKRFTNTIAEPNLRFHYRYIAADHADAAANLLPPRSQAFAAVLCHEASYIRLRDPDRGAAIYKRYVTQGAFVPWASDFGQTCPEPDFAAARHFRVIHLAGKYEGMLRRHARLAGLAMLGLLAACAGGVAIGRHKRGKA